MTTQALGHYEILPEDGEQELLALVRAPQPDLAGTLCRANEALEREGSGWRLEAEEGGTHPFVIPLEVTFRQPAGVRPLPGTAELARFLDTLRLAVPLFADVMLFPSPGHKPHAGPPPLTRGDFNRVPVAVLAEPPRRSAAAAGRRPVVALLDTSVDPHPWLGEPDQRLGGDGFWVDARSLGWDPGPRVHSPAPPDGPELGDNEGHGTFSAGLVRQVAPDAQVLAVRVIPDRGQVHGDHVLNALAWLAADSRLVDGDVVCLPAGLRPGLPTDRTFLEWLAEVLELLAGRGVRVVAAAGNDGRSEPVYPAAFAASAGVPDGVRVVSVGATNPDGKTPAYFSNHGSWVTRWEVGTSVVSTFPRVNGGAAPELVAGPGPSDPAGFERRSADPDDFSGGFARWSGTSFAAAICAARLARAGSVPAPPAGVAPAVLR